MKIAAAFTTFVAVALIVIMSPRAGAAFGW